jgi:hypothetical protein
VTVRVRLVLRGVDRQRSERVLDATSAPAATEMTGRRRNNAGRRETAALPREAVIRRDPAGTGSPVAS